MGSISDLYKKNKNYGTQTAPRGNAGGGRIKQEIPKYSGQVGIRATLNNMGISNSSIGYDPSKGDVTINGKSFMKPQYLDDAAGVSYANEADIQKGLVDYYSTTSNPIVQVSDYYTNAAGGYGINANALGYSNGMATVGGSPLNTLYTDDNGKAWAYANDVQNGVQNYANEVGVKNPNDILKKYNSRYEDKINSLLESLANREEFTYNPDDDPVYAAYKAKFLGEGNRAAENAMATYSNLTGGYANSAAATAAGMSQQYYAGQLGNTIPELASMAYQRYSDSYQNDLNMANQYTNTYKTMLENALSANDKTVSNVNNVNKSNVDRDAKSIENMWNNIFNTQKKAANEQQYEWTEKKNFADSYWQNILNVQKQQSNYIDYDKKVLERDELKKYLRDYYDSIMDNKIENSTLENLLKREQIKIAKMNSFGF
ncbi:MAG: hypothetical protein RSB38_03765 [Oscillospiraceae bacterium]